MGVTTREFAGENPVEIELRPEHAAISSRTIGETSKPVRKTVAPRKIEKFFSGVAPNVARLEHDIKALGVEGLSQTITRGIEEAFAGKVGPIDSATLRTYFSDGTVGRLNALWERAQNNPCLRELYADQISRLLCAAFRRTNGESPVEGELFYQPGEGIVAVLRLIDGTEVEIDPQRWNRLFPFGGKVQAKDETINRMFRMLRASYISRLAEKTIQSFEKVAISYTMRHHPAEVDIASWVEARMAWPLESIVEDLLEEEGMHCRPTSLHKALWDVADRRVKISGQEIKRSLRLSITWYDSFDEFMRFRQPLTGRLRTIFLCPFTLAQHRQNDRTWIVEDAMATSYRNSERRQRHEAEARKIRGQLERSAKSPEGYPLLRHRTLPSDLRELIASFVQEEGTQCLNRIAGWEWQFESAFPNQASALFTLASRMSAMPKERPELSAAA